MGRGVSAGGGQSSLGYLFGSGEAPKPSTSSTATGGAAAAAAAAANDVPPTQNEVAKQTPQEPATDSASPPADAAKQTPAGVPGKNVNNYFRSEGQNCGNFLTDRPTTKVHAAPGGGSSLDYLFGGDGK